MRNRIYLFADRELFMEEDEVLYRVPTTGPRERIVDVGESNSGPQTQPTPPTVDQR